MQADAAPRTVLYERNLRDASHTAQCGTDIYKRGDRPILIGAECLQLLDYDIEKRGCAGCGSRLCLRQKILGCALPPPFFRGVRLSRL